MLPVAALNVDADAKVIAAFIALAVKYALYCVAFTSEPVATIVCEPAVCAPENTKFDAALVTVLLAWMLSVDVPVVNAHR